MAKLNNKKMRTFDESLLTCECAGTLLKKQLEDLRRKIFNMACEKPVDAKKTEQLFAQIDLMDLNADVIIKSATEAREFFEQMKNEGEAE